MLRIDRRIQGILQRLRVRARRIGHKSAAKKRLSRELQQERERRQLAERQLERTKERHRGQLRLLRQHGKETSREYLLCKMPKQSVCAEIGVFRGSFSQQILDNVQPRKLHLIDPWKYERTAEWPRTLEEENRDQNTTPGGRGDDGQAATDERYREVKERFTEEIRTGQVQMHRNLSSMVADDFEDSYFDWIYIDGNHFYEFVKQDLELYYPKVKRGGYIAGDDYGLREDFGVRRAVDEFVSRRSDLTLEVRFDQFIIKKGCLT